MTLIRFREQLKHQLTFIANSCDGYDRGQVSEAIRIGTSLRVLLRDTRQSISLLKHLDAKQVPLLSTCKVRESIPHGTAFDGLASFSVAGIRPKLGQSSTLIELPANEWWKQPVIGLGHGRNLSRAIIALTAANKDGGAHVDADLPPEYVALVDGVWTSSRDGQIAGHNLLYLRQIGYEVLNSPKLTALVA